jgi:hypothetical protein
MGPGRLCELIRSAWSSGEKICDPKFCRDRDRPGRNQPPEEVHHVPRR